MLRKFALTLLVLGILFNFGLILSKTGTSLTPETLAVDGLVLSELEEEILAVRQEIEATEKLINASKSEAEQAVLTERLNLLKQKEEILENSITTAAGTQIPSTPPAATEEPSKPSVPTLPGGISLPSTPSPAPDPQTTSELDLSRQVSVAKVNLSSLQTKLTSLIEGKALIEADIQKLEALLKESPSGQDADSVKEDIVLKKTELEKRNKDIALQQKKIENASIQLEIAQKQLGLFQKRSQDVSQKTLPVLIEQAKVFSKNLQNMIPSILSGLIVLVLFYFLSHLCVLLIRRFSKRRRHHVAFYTLVANVCRLVVIFLGIIACLQIVGLGYVTSAVIASLGLIGLALGLSLQDILKNFFAGIMISIEEPFDIGDIVNIDKYTGRIRKIRLRTTVLEQFSGEIVSIPNSYIINASVENCSDKGRRRFFVDVGVAYATDLKHAEDVGLKALKKTKGVMKEPEPMFHAREFGDSSISLRFYFWIDTEEYKILRVRSDAIHAVHEAFKKEKIIIPFPQRDVHMINAHA